MNAKLLGLVSGAAVLALSITTTPVHAFPNADQQNASGWSLALDLNGAGTFSGMLALQAGLQGETPSELMLTDWIFTYSPSSRSTVGQFTLDASNADIEFLYCDSCKLNPDELEVVIRICCVTV